MLTQIIGACRYEMKPLSSNHIENNVNLNSLQVFSSQLAQRRHLDNGGSDDYDDSIK